MIGGAVALVWLFMAKVMKISSLAALVSMALAPVFVWLIWPAPELILMQIAMTLILVWRHRSNIQKMLAGDEDKISKD